MIGKVLTVALFIMLAALWIPLLLILLAYDFAKGLHDIIALFVRKIGPGS